MAGQAEGVFSRSKPQQSNGELVDRLMAKIAELEARLYEKDLHGNDLIAAVRGGPGTAPAGGPSAQHKKQPQPQQQQQQAEHDLQGSKSEWLTGMASTWIKGGCRPEQEQHTGASEATGAAKDSAAAAGAFSWVKQIYKHAVDAPDMESEQEETQHVRKAAHEAVMEARRRCEEAETKLRRAEAARAELEQQLEAAAELNKEVEALKEENMEAWRTKYGLEQEVAGMRAQLEGMQRQTQSAQQAIDDMHSQAQLWKYTAGGEVEKLRAENALVASQLAARAAEAAATAEELATRAAEVAGLQAEKDMLAGQLAAAAAESAAKGEQLVAAAAAAAAAAEQAATLQSERGRVAGQLAAATAEVAELRSAQQAAAAEAATAAAAAAMAESKLAASEKQLAELRSGQLAAATADAARLTAEVAVARDQLAAAVADAAAKAEEVAAARQQHAAVAAELETQKAAGSALKAALEALAKEHQQQAAEQQRMQAQLSTLATLQARLAVAEPKLAAAEAELVHTRAVAAEAEVKLAGLGALQRQLEAVEGQLVAVRGQAADADEKFLKERAARRKLHEQLQVLRGNIRVMCRVRPPLPGARSAITYPLEGSLAITDAMSGRHREFEFDSVFAPAVTQQQVFEEVAPLVRSCADGYNACIFAYGQTGSGKTYTMEGPEDSPGINTRALQELFRIAAEEPDKQWAFSVAVMEIYNEAVHDLLSADVARPLEVTALGAGELPSHIERVQGLVWRKVANTDQVRAALKEGSRNRATAATALNSASSRSHALVCVKVQAVSQGKAINSVLHLVDLAGSERVDKSEVAGQQMKEAQAINKSLSALGDVISALQRRTPHIPFRNSKLTQVLQDALCGSSKVLLVCQVSPEAASCSETMSSLNFASRAAQVELGQARRMTGDKVATAPGSSGGRYGGSSGGSTSGSGIAGDSGSGGAGGSGTGSSGGALESSPSSSNLLRPGSRLSSARAGSPAVGPGGTPRSPSASAVFAKPARH